MLNYILDSKHYALSQSDVCRIIVKILSMLCATLIPSQQDCTMVQLHMEKIGFILETHVSAAEKQEDVSMKDTTSESSETPFDSSHPFALPAPARDTLISAAITLLSNTWFIRSTSPHLRLPNKDKETDLISFVIPWKPLFHLLVRTSPILHELSDNGYPDMSHSRKSSIVRKTSTLIQYCRCFFDQQDLSLLHTRNDEGATITVKVHNLPIVDKTAKEIWNLLRYDLMARRHTNACFRSLVLLYLFFPTVCSQEFYMEVMPQWMECWLSVDRCNDFDFLWLNLFCRARKYVPYFDWAQVRRKLLSQCGYWLQIPVTGASNDRSFPNISPMKSRSVPGFLKVLVGSSSSYQEGVDFVEKLSTLLVFCIGKNDQDPKVEKSLSVDVTKLDVSKVSSGTADLIRFLSFVGPYFNPTNVGGWTFPLGVMLNFLCAHFAQRVGTEVGQSVLASSHPFIAEEMAIREPYLKDTIPEHEIPLILDALLPLCQQSIYSKNMYVGKAGEASLLCLVQITPTFISPYFLDFAAKALDVSSINLSHQAPSALGVLDRLLQPSLRRNPSMILQRLPNILALTLLGIDSNDRRKTIATLTFYHTVTSWLPVGSVCCSHKCEKQNDQSRRRKDDGTVRLGDNLVEYIAKIEKSEAFRKSVSQLSEGTFVLSGDPLDLEIDEIERELYNKELLEETALSIGDWALAFLDRVYELLRAAGKQEKVSKNHLGASVRHTSSDAQQSKSFSRLLTTCLIRVFSAMDAKTYQRAVDSVCRFLSSETLPFAAKDSSSLCKAVTIAKDDGYGFNALVPIMTRDLAKLSTLTACYRLRCLSGAVKYSGEHLLSFDEVIFSAINFALSASEDGEQKQLFKTGCKLLRHALASQVEAIPLLDNSQFHTYAVGKPAALHGDPINWHSPTDSQLDFAVEILERIAFSRLRKLFSAVPDTDELASSQRMIESLEIKSDSDDSFDEKASKTDETIQKSITREWRASLKILKYSLRGVVGVLFDEGLDCSDLSDAIPYENGFDSLLEPASQSTKDALKGLRGKLCALITAIIGVISRETYAERSESSSKSIVSAISLDTKICKEIIEVSNILLTRRGANSKGWQTRAGQQEALQDEVLSSEVIHISSAFERASEWTANEAFLYRDGEDGGKVIPRNLLAYKVWLFHLEVQRNASYETPRALRKRRMRRPGYKGSKQILFSMQKSFGEVQKAALVLLNWSVQSQDIDALDAYEGLIDGLVALSCHPKLHVRSCAMGALESGLSRFVFFARPRIPRLLEALDLSDNEGHGKYGVPSCYQLAYAPDVDGKRKRLAEVVRGVCSIVSNSRMMRHALASESTRFQLIQTLCGTQRLLSLLPQDELHKMVHFLQIIFSKFRSHWHTLPKFTAGENKLHNESLVYLLRQLDGCRHPPEEKTMESDFVNVNSDANLMHWRNQLLIGWFLTHLASPDDARKEALGKKLWTTSFHLIEKNMSQPIQRVALGLLGRLVTFAERQRSDDSLVREQCLMYLQDKLQDEQICRCLCLSLAFNHRQDTEIGGGSRAQWSAGIEEILRDAGSSLSPTLFFPFSRDPLSSGIFKLQHAQLIRSLLILVEYNVALSAAKSFLAVSKELSLA